jgi:hypothetical protein
MQLSMPNGHKIYQHFPFQGRCNGIARIVIFSCVSKYTIWQPWFRARKSTKPNNIFVINARTRLNSAKAGGTNHRRNKILLLPDELLKFAIRPFLLFAFMSPTDIHKDIKRHWKRKEGDEKKNLLAK